MNGWIGMVIGYDKIGRRYWMDKMDQNITNGKEMIMMIMTIFDALMIIFMEQQLQQTKKKSKKSKKKNTKKPQNPTKRNQKKSLTNSLMSSHMIFSFFIIYP